MGTINYVWMGRGPLGPLERFNIYSWRCLGYDVGIYTVHFTHGSAFDFSSLGLDSEDGRFNASGLSVHDLPALLQQDEREVDWSEDDPRRHCRHMRSLLIYLLQVADHAFDGVEAEGLDPDSRRDQIFNIVDLAKSYLAATRRGLTMDFKVGPSPHLAAYEASFDEKFISFRRGSLMPGNAPENQCLGTNQVESTIRCKYATHFNKWVTGWSGVVEIPGADEGVRSHPRGKHYDKITATHAKFFTSNESKRDCLNVTEQAPDGKPIMGRYPFSGIAGEEARGPFRVFKKASDQTNQSSGEKTTPLDVKRIAHEVVHDEVLRWPNWDAVDGYYKEKLLEAFQDLPTE